MSEPSFTKYNIGLLAWSIAFLAAGAVGLWILNQVGRLPPPPLTATFCIDEKFRFMRDAVARKPDLLAIGSSVTWRNLDLSTLKTVTAAPVNPLNGAPCYVMVHETAYLTQFYLDNIPSVRTVVSVFAMRDFEDCKSDPAFFDRAAAKRYVFDGRPAWHLYFLNFRPKPLLRDVIKIRGMRSGSDIKNPINMDPYGSGPLLITPPEIREDMAPTSECFDHLETMARDLAARGVTWSVVLLPPMPAWLKAYDPIGERDRQWREMVAQRLNGSGAILIDGRGGPVIEDRNFADPLHLHWSSVPEFSEWVFRQIATRSKFASGREMNGAL